MLLTLFIHLRLNAADVSKKKEVIVTSIQLTEDVFNWILEFVCFFVQLGVYWSLTISVFLTYWYEFILNKLYLSAWCMVILVSQGRLRSDQIDQILRFVFIQHWWKQLKFDNMRWSHWQYKKTHKRSTLSAGSPYGAGMVQYGAMWCKPTAPAPTFRLPYQPAHTAVRTSHQETSNCWSSACLGRWRIQKTSHRCSHCLKTLLSTRARLPTLARR